MPNTPTTEQQYKTRNLKLINDWIRDLMKDSKKILYLDRAVCCNQRYYTASISSSGIALHTDGRYSTWIPVRDESILRDNLLYLKPGTELIYAWQNIKARIRHKKKR